MRHLKIDGMLSGTGIRDARAGGYLDPGVLGLSPDLIQRIETWVLAYEAAHYRNFNDAIEIQRLDREGIEIAWQTREQLAGSEVEYFSHALMQKIDFK